MVFQLWNHACQVFQYLAQNEHSVHVMLSITINQGLSAVANRTCQASLRIPDPRLSFQSFAFYALKIRLLDMISIQEKVLLF